MSHTNARQNVADVTATSQARLAMSVSLFGHANIRLRIVTATFVRKLQSYECLKSKDTQRSLFQIAFIQSQLFRKSVYQFTWLSASSCQIIFLICFVPQTVKFSFEHGSYRTQPYARTCASGVVWSRLWHNPSHKIIETIVHSFRAVSSRFVTFHLRTRQVTKFSGQKVSNRSGQNPFVSRFKLQKTHYFLTLVLFPRTKGKL